MACLQEPLQPRIQVVSPKAKAAQGFLVPQTVKKYEKNIPAMPQFRPLKRQVGALPPLASGISGGISRGLISGEFQVVLRIIQNSSRMLKEKLQEGSTRDVENQFVSTVDVAQQVPAKPLVWPQAHQRPRRQGRMKIAIFEAFLDVSMWAIENSPVDWDQVSKSTVPKYWVWW